jgi:hypothetical protein
VRAAIRKVEWTEVGKDEALWANDARHLGGRLLNTIDMLKDRCGCDKVERIVRKSEVSHIHLCERNALVATPLVTRDEVDCSNSAWTLSRPEGKFLTSSYAKNQQVRAINRRVSPCPTQMRFRLIASVGETHFREVHRGKIGGPSLEIPATVLKPN